MKKILGYAFTLIIGFGAGAVFTGDVSASSFQPNPIVQQGTNAAYRDGFYMGKNDFAAGRANHIASGRWSTMPDRAQYEAGYDAGYASN